MRRRWEMKWKEMHRSLSPTELLCCLIMSIEGIALVRAWNRPHRRTVFINIGGLLERCFLPTVFFLPSSCRTLYFFDRWHHFTKLLTSFQPKSLSYTSGTHHSAHALQKSTYTTPTVEHCSKTSVGRWVKSYMMCAFETPTSSPSLTKQNDTYAWEQEVCIVVCAQMALSGRCRDGFPATLLLFCLTFCFFI